MADFSHTGEPGANVPVTGPSGEPGGPRRTGGNRSADVRDAMAELADKAQMISQEAASRVSTAMRDVVGSAAGLAGFAVESARDLVQYMVRRGQMTSEDADRLLGEVAAAQKRRPARDRKSNSPKTAPDRAARARADARARAAASPAYVYTPRPGAVKASKSGSDTPSIATSAASTPTAAEPAKAKAKKAANVTTKKPAKAKAPPKTASRSTKKPTKNAARSAKKSAVAKRKATKSPVKKSAQRPKKSAPKPRKKR